MLFRSLVSILTLPQCYIGQAYNLTLKAVLRWEFSILHQRVGVGPSV